MPEFRAGSLLALNAGSSSVKFSLFSLDVAGRLALHARGSLEGIGTGASLRANAPDGTILVERAWNAAQPDYDEMLQTLLAWTEAALGDLPLVAAGHRFVHGGRRFTAPVVIDEASLTELDLLVPLAPLHQPHSLALVRSLRALHPGLAQVACFDTAFHAGNSPTARRFGIPRALEAAGIVRYGFHGLSFEYVARELARLDPEAARGRTIVAHLGNGASLCALDGGRSVATTMGFSVLDGLVMGTRCGSLDPAVVLYLLKERGLNVGQVERLLYEESGLLGVSGVAADMRTLEASRAPEAAEAIDLFVYRIVREAGSMAAALGGLETVVFTAGIGEHDARIRSAVCRALGWLGIELNEPANEAAAQRISAAGSRVGVWIVPTDEERTIAEHTVQAIG